MLKFKKEHIHSERLGVTEVRFNQNLPDIKTHVLISMLCVNIHLYGLWTQASLNGGDEGETIQEKSNLLLT